MDHVRLNSSLGFNLARTRGSLRVFLHRASQNGSRPTCAADREMVNLLRVELLLPLAPSFPLRILSSQQASQEEKVSRKHYSSQQRRVQSRDFRPARNTRDL